MPEAFLDPSTSYALASMAALSEAIETDPFSADTAAAIRGELGDAPPAPPEDGRESEDSSTPQPSQEREGIMRVSRTRDWRPRRLKPYLRSSPPAVSLQPHRRSRSTSPWNTTRPQRATRTSQPPAPPSCISISWSRSCAR